MSQKSCSERNCRINSDTVPAMRLHSVFIQNLFRGVVKLVVPRVCIEGRSYRVCSAFADALPTTRQPCILNSAHQRQLHTFYTTSTTDVVVASDRGLQQQLSTSTSAMAGPGEAAENAEEKWKDRLGQEEAREFDNSLFFEYEFSIDQLMEIAGLCVAQVREAGLLFHRVTFFILTLPLPLSPLRLWFAAIPPRKWVWPGRRCWCCVGQGTMEGMGWPLPDTCSSL